MAKPDAPPVYETIVRAKGMFDDCKTLTEMMQRCDAGKETLQKYIAAGVSLQQPVDDDYAFLVTQDAKIGKRMKMDRREQEDG
jgi:hypothetical protein